MEIFIFLIVIGFIVLLVVQADKRKKQAQARQVYQQQKEAERLEVELNVQELNRVLESSLELVKNSKNYKTRIGRIDDCIGYLERLKEYEHLSYVTVDPPAAEMIKQLKSLNDEILIEEVEGLFNKAKIKVEHAKTASAKTNSLIKVLSKIEDFKESLVKSDALDGLELKIKQYIQFVELDTLLEDAKKSEFKGGIKKALNSYQEALYLLNADTTYPELKEKYLDEVELKIRELIPEG